MVVEVKINFIQIIILLNDPSKQFEKRDLPLKIPAPDYKDKIDWFYVIWFSLVHAGAFYGLLMSGKLILTTVYGNYAYFLKNSELGKIGEKNNYSVFINPSILLVQIKFRKNNGKKKKIRFFSYLLCT